MRCGVVGITGTDPRAKGATCSDLTVGDDEIAKGGNALLGEARTDACTIGPVHVIETTLEFNMTDDRHAGAGMPGAESCSEPPRLNIEDSAIDYDVDDFGPRSETTGRAKTGRTGTKAGATLIPAE